MTNLSELRHLLATRQHIAIIPHLRPDGDAMGSSLGLMHFLAQHGHHATVLVPTEVPDYLQWMPGTNTVQVATQDLPACQKTLADAGVIFCLDFGVLNRAGLLEAPIRKSTKPKVHIDHHLDADNFAQYELRDTTASSTCELVYRFIHRLEARTPITEACATCLYTGIMTDTGSFRFETATADVHRVVADLIGLGVDVARVHQRVFNNFTEGRTRFLGHVLAQKLVVLPELHTAYMTVTQQELKQFSVAVADTEGLVNYALGIQGINFGVILIEHPDQVKLSFRSVGTFSANAFAANFSGGGHFHAAGGQSKDNLAQTEKRFLELLLHYRKELNYTLN
jgi:phosphoesterase RecJ-like protein